MRTPSSISVCATMSRASRVSSECMCSPGRSERMRITWARSVGSVGKPPGGTKQLPPSAETDEAGAAGAAGGKYME